MRHALGQPARVHEDQRGPVLAHEHSQAIVDLGPHLGAGDGSQLVPRNFDREFHRAAMPHLDDPRAGAQEARHFFDGAHRRRKPYLLQGPAHQRFEPGDR